jgi:putative tryptophan/tyrosine transport system substrate-binding protein
VTGQSRRQLLRRGLAAAGLGLLSGCARLPWQSQPKMPRIGYLSAGSRERDAAFRQGLEELGYVEGRTVTIEWRDPAGQSERVPDLAAELVRLPVDILVTDGATATRAARGATSAIPVVILQIASPVEDGYVASLAHPGGNITGLTSMAPELIGKRLELLKAAVPGVSRVGMLWNPGAAPERAGDFQLAEAATGPLGLEVRSLEAREPGALDGAFERAVRERVDGLSVIDNVVLTSNAVRIGELAQQHRLPMMSANRPLVAAGGLVAYGPNFAAMARRAATYVDKILKGTKPADLPVERPPLFEFVINLKAAQALGLTIPSSVLQQATEVIQ